MSTQYDEYVWRLSSDTPAFDIQLPQDLEWVDEFTWSPVQQNVSTSLTGALIIQEQVQQKGRPITLQGKDDMAWVQRPLGDILMQMRDTAGLVMTLDYVSYIGSSYGPVLFSYEVMFRHYDPPVLDLESVKRFDNFEPDAWYKVRNIKFMEAVAGATKPCTANVTLTLTGISGTFSIGQTVTGGTSSTSGIVLSSVGTVLNLYVTEGEFQSGEIVTGATGSATVV